MPFFTYSQNNSGGFFEPPYHQVIVEASNEEEANSLAESVGLYFDGSHSGRDCPCCGDRWHSCCDYDGEEVPSSYGEPLEEGSYYYCGLGTLILYKDGRKIAYLEEGKPPVEGTWTWGNLEVGQ